MDPSVSQSLGFVPSIVLPTTTSSFVYTQARPFTVFTTQISSSSRSRIAVSRTMNSNTNTKMTLSMVNIRDVSVDPELSIDDSDVESLSESELDEVVDEAEIQASMVEEDTEEGRIQRHLERGDSSSEDAGEEIRATKRFVEGVVSHKFENYRVSAVSVVKLAEKNIDTMTDVQYGTYDHVFDGRDIIARSRTGTGKTLAFGLPIIEKLVLAKGTADDTNGIGKTRGRGPSCLILAPTRELAMQVSRELDFVGKAHGLATECFYGGSSYGPQENAIRRGIDILVGTPGRLIDVLGRGTVDTSGIKFMVLDEADEMLSMGFAEDVDQIMEFLPSKNERQTILFSATIPPWIKSIAKRHQTDPVMFDAIGEGTTMAATTVRHCAVQTPRDFESRAAFLDDIITVYGGGFGGGRSIVFTQTKKEADELATSGAIKSGAAVLHGDVTQKQREHTLQQFRQGRFQVLVATDVAARGLDISGVDLVVQFRVPMDTESYIHRAGRTGRAGRAGTAVIMYSRDEMRALKKLAMDTQVRFERHGLPSMEKVLQVSAKLAAESIDEVDPKVVGYFRSHAEEVLNSENPVDKMAAALALIARRREIVERSIVTGDPDQRTMLIKAKEPLNVPSVVRMVSKLAEKLEISINLGRVQMCHDPTMAVFDLPIDQADLLLSADLSKLKTFMIGVAKELPRLEESSMGGGGGGSGGGYRGASGGGYNRDAGRSGYRGDRPGGDRAGGRTGYSRSSYSQRPSSGRPPVGGVDDGEKREGWSRDRGRPDRRSARMY